MEVHVALLVFVSMAGAFIYRHKPCSKRKNRLFLRLSFLAIFLVQALRGHNVGLDTDDYVRLFIRARYNIFPAKWEYCFYLLTKLTLCISDNPQVFLAICSLLILTGIFIFIDNNTDDDQSAFWPVFFFIVLTQYFSTMNLLRQSLSMAVGCNVYTVLRKDRSTKGFIFSALLIIIAQMFHESGFICILLFLPFLMKEINRRSMFLGALIAGSSLFAYSFILRFFIRIFPRYARYIGGVFDTASTSGVYLLFGVIELIMIVVCLVFLNPEDPNNTDVYRLLFVILYSFTLILMQRRIALARRLGYYFELFLIMLIPAFVNKWKKNERLFLKAGFYCFGWAYFIYSMTASNARGCVPYLFFWQQ